MKLLPAESLVQFDCPFTKSSFPHAVHRASPVKSAGGGYEIQHFLGIRVRQGVGQPDRHSGPAHRAKLERTGQPARRGDERVGARGGWHCQLVQVYNVLIAAEICGAGNREQIRSKVVVVSKKPGGAARLREVAGEGRGFNGTDPARRNRSRVIKVISRPNIDDSPGLEKSAGFMGEGI